MEDFIHLNMVHNNLILQVTVKKNGNIKNQTNDSINSIVNKNLELSDIIDVKVRKNSLANRVKNFFSLRKPIDFDQVYYARSLNSLPKIIEFKKHQMELLEKRLESGTDAKSIKRITKRIGKIKEEICLLQFKEAPQVISKKTNKDLKEVSKIANDSPRNQFINLYRTKIAHLEGLKLDEKDFQKSIDEVMALSDEIEFNPLKENILKLLDDINEKILNGTIVSDPKQIKMIVNDFILFHCLVPIKITKQGKYIQRYSADVITSQFLEQILLSLTHSSKTDISMNLYFRNIPLNKYNELPIEKKMLYLNLTNMDSDSRKTILDSSFFKKFLSSLDKLDATKWFFACSGAVEQHYLNTCVGASVCQKLMSKTLSLPQLLVIIECAFKELEEKSSTIKDESSKKYFTQRMNREKKNLHVVKNNMAKVIEQANDVSPEELQVFTKELCKIIQKIGLLENVDALAHPTKKIIKDRWLLSAVLMTPIVLLQHFIGFRTPPSITMRLNSSKGDLFDIENDLNIPGFANNEFSLESKQFVSEFWMDVKDMNGAMIGKDRHSYFLKAIIHNGKKVFILNDPKHSNYKVLTQSQFIRFMHKK